MSRQLLIREREVKFMREKDKEREKNDNEIII